MQYLYGSNFVKNVLISGAIEKPPTRRVQVVSPHGFSALHAYSPSSPGPRSSMASVTWGPGKVVKVVTLALYVISKEDWLGCCG